MGSVAGTGLTHSRESALGYRRVARSGAAWGCLLAVQCIDRIRIRVPLRFVSIRPGVLGFLVLLIGLIGCGNDFEIVYDGPIADWPYWGGDQGATHYSPLNQITRDNVSALEVVWTHRSGDFFDGSGSSKVTALQVTPLVVNDHLYYCTPFMRIFAV